jgi:uncharacterized protein with HEPN domain
MKEKYFAYIDELNRHNRVIEKIFKKIGDFPLDKEKVEDLIEENVELLDSLAYRFSKFQDTLGKAIKFWLILKGENVDNLPIIDVINIAEKIGLSINKDLWWEMEIIRNEISHEYEIDYEEVAKTLNNIYIFYPKLQKILMN